MREGGTRKEGRKKRKEGKRKEESKEGTSLLALYAAPTRLM